MLVQHYGLVALFLLMALESSMILSFVPGEAIVAFASIALATSWIGVLAVILVSTLGATTGALALYLFARSKGRAFVQRHGARFGLDSKRGAKLEAWFARPAGERLVFILRLVPLLRGLVSVPAALSRMDARRFVAYTLGGTLVLNTVLALLAFGSFA